MSKLNSDILRRIDEVIIDIYGSELQQKWNDNKYQTTFSKLGFQTFSIDQNKYNFVNDYFKNIIPCGIENKDVTSIEKEIKKKITTREVEKKVIKNLSKVFGFKIF